ncbi:MAG: tetratricopeptide repeat protein, partial [Tepidisphaeraceae bacterium]
ADRPVVLKITPLDGEGGDRGGDGGEHLSLARLQHTNIVPLYAVIGDAKRSVRILCMPFFGRATLAWLLESLAGVPLHARSGRHVVDAIDRAGAFTDEIERVPPPTPGAARQMLASVSYVQAMCWITACLADALQFAHERGLVHLDLKPSNVLLANDGQPMLLDFHLARQPILPDGPLPDNFGGTPPYMPPEQLAAMESLKSGRPVEIAVDGRADLYALGAILYEALGGRLPISEQSPPLATVNPQASAGLSEIVAKCLSPRAQDRYGDATALADDLRRHLTDQPLVGVRNRSRAERWHKWRRRRPSTLRTAGMLGILAVAIVIALASVWSRLHDRHEQAERALYDGQRQMQSGRGHAEAVQTFERGLNLVQSLPFEQDLRRQLRDQLAAARRLHLSHQLHLLADDLRAAYGADAIPPNRLRSLAAQCAAFWQKRDVIVRSIAAAEDPNLSADLQDIAICAASIQTQLSQASETKSESQTAHRDALRLLDEAEAMFGPSAVLTHERKRLAVASAPLAASHAPNDSSLSTSAHPPPRTAWEHAALGRALLASGALPDAARELTAALELDPTGCWPNFYFGLCAYRMGRYADAVSAFSVCIGTAPEVAGFFYNRALAYAALNRPDNALRDYDHALEIDPAHANAALNRGMLHFQQGRLDQATADLRRALDRGADAATVHYNLERIHLIAKGTNR